MNIRQGKWRADCFSDSIQPDEWLYVTGQTAIRQKVCWTTVRSNTPWRPNSAIGSRYYLNCSHRPKNTVNLELHNDWLCVIVHKRYCSTSLWIQLNHTQYSTQRTRGCTNILTLYTGTRQNFIWKISLRHLDSDKHSIQENLYIVHISVFGDRRLLPQLGTQSWSSGEIHGGWPWPPLTPPRFKPLRRVTTMILP